MGLGTVGDAPPEHVNQSELLRIDELVDPMKPTIGVFMHESFSDAEVLAIAAKNLELKGRWVPNVVILPWIDEEKDELVQGLYTGYYGVKQFSVIDNNLELVRVNSDTVLPIDMVDVSAAGPDIAEQFEQAGVKLMASSENMRLAESKESTRVIAEKAGVRYPQSVVISRAEDVDEAVDEYMTKASFAKSGIVVKPLNGSRGMEVQMFDKISEISAREKLKAILLHGSPVIVEERIRSKSLSLTPGGERYDWNIRAIVKNKYLDSYARANVWGGPVNISQGSHSMTLDSVLGRISDTHAEETTLKKRLKKASTKVAKVLDGDIAGIDMTIDEDGQPVLIEANIGNFGGINTLRRLASSPEEAVSLSEKILLQTAKEFRRFDSRVIAFKTLGMLGVLGMEELGVHSETTGVVAGVKQKLTTTLDQLSMEVSDPQASLFTEQKVHEMHRFMNDQGMITDGEHVFETAKLLNLMDQIKEYRTCTNICELMIEHLPNSADAMSVAADYERYFLTGGKSLEFADMLIDKNPKNMKNYIRKIDYLQRNGVSDLVGAIRVLYDIKAIDPKSAYLKQGIERITDNHVNFGVNFDEDDPEFMNEFMSNQIFACFELISTYIDQGAEHAQKYLENNFANLVGSEDKFANDIATVAFGIMVYLHASTRDTVNLRKGLKQLKAVDIDSYDEAHRVIFDEVEEGYLDESPEFIRIALERNIEFGIMSSCLSDLSAISKSNSLITKYTSRRLLAESILEDHSGTSKDRAKSIKIAERALTFYSDGDYVGAIKEAKVLISELRDSDNENADYGSHILLLLATAEAQDMETFRSVPEEKVNTHLRYKYEIDLEIASESISADREELLAKAENNPRRRMHIADFQQSLQERNKQRST